MIDHTPEPWDYLDDPPRIVSESHPDYCIAQYLQEGNAKRILAAIAFTRGIPTEALGEQVWNSIFEVASYAAANNPHEPGPATFPSSGEIESARRLLRLCEQRRASVTPVDVGRET